MKVRVAITLILLLAMVSSAVFAADAPRTRRVVLAVSGMYCGSCASGIKAMLKRTDGVTSAEVSYAKKEAVMDFDPSKTSTEKIIEAIANLGYTAKRKKADQAS